MQRITILLLAAILCLTAAACSKKPEPEESAQEPTPGVTGVGETAEETQPESGSSGQRGDTAEKPEEPVQENIEIIGPWHLDGEKNDLAAFEDRFPGYAEWGASMEIRSGGQMSWYIGAEGWHGTYVMDEETLHAELDSELEERTLSWDFRIAAENETAMLEMDYEDMTVYWMYGDQEDPAVGHDGKS